MRTIYLTNADSKRLAEWLSHFEIKPEGIFYMRWNRMRRGTAWIEAGELEILNNELQPLGMATDVIRGGCVLTSVEEIAI